MHVKSLFQGFNVDLAQPGPPDPEAKYLPQDHDATRVQREKVMIMKTLYK